MESLCGYGSDDDYDESSQPKKQSSSQADANYEEVQMDLNSIFQQESNDSTKLESRRQSSDHHHPKGSYSDAKEKEHAEKDKYKHRLEQGRYSPKHQDSRRDDKYRDRGRSDDDRNRDRDDKAKDERSRDYKRDRNRDDKNKFRVDERSRDSRKSRDDQEKYRDRGHDSHDNNKDDRRPRRTSSRDRHRSRSPRRSDYRSKRSSSRDRGRSGYSKRYDRTSSKMDRLEKLGIELNTSGSGYASTSSHPYDNDKEQDKDRFFMPGITGRFTEQIQRRKMLWQKKEPPAETSTVEPPNAGIHSGKIWQNTTFAQDTDGKVANKFKRLMGIRGSEAEGAKSTVDTLKKQEEMFSSMEAQYEVARTATHTMRGVGLGFGSFQR